MDIFMAFLSSQLYTKSQGLNVYFHNVHVDARI